MSRLRQLALLLLLLLANFALRAQDVLPVPPLSGRVIDQTGTLTASQADGLTKKLAAFEAESGPQIVILMVPTTLPEDIAAYAQRIGDAWKIGRRDVGDGLLIVVAKNDRRVNIQTAKALEGAVPDLATRQIIDSAIRPAFRADEAVELMLDAPSLPDYLGLWDKFRSRWQTSLTYVARPVLLESDIVLDEGALVETRDFRHGQTDTRTPGGQP